MSKSARAREQNRYTKHEKRCKPFENLWIFVSCLMGASAYFCKFKKPINGCYVCACVWKCVCVSFSFAVHLVKTYNTNNKCTLICVNRHKIGCVRFFWLSLVCTHIHTNTPFSVRFIYSKIMSMRASVRAFVHACVSTERTKMITQITQIEC